MSDSSLRPWADFFHARDASLLLKNAWVGFLLLNLAIRYPFITRGQMFEFAQLFDVPSKFVRPAIHALTSGGLLRAVPWQNPRPDLGQPIRSVDSQVWDFIFLGTTLRDEPAPWPYSPSTPEPVYCLPNDAPGSEVVRELRVAHNRNLPPPMSCRKDAKRPQRRKGLLPLENAINWLGLAEIHLRMTLHGEQSANGFVAASQRIAAYRNDVPLLPEKIHDPQVLDAAFGLLLAESKRVSKENATAVTFYSLLFVDVDREDCEQEIPEAQQWRQFEIWPHKDRVQSPKRRTPADQTTPTIPTIPEPPSRVPNPRVRRHLYK